MKNRLGFGVFLWPIWNRSPEFPRQDNWTCTVSVMLALASAACFSADPADSIDWEQAACRVDEPDIAAPEPPISLVIGQDCTNDIALLDDTIAWVTQGLDTGASYSGGDVAMKPKIGGTASEWVDVHEGRLLARYGDYVYWAGRNKIGRVRKDGLSKKILVSDSTTPLSPRGLAVDDGHVYFTTGDAVKSVPRDGGTVTVLASGQATPSGLAVDDTHVYWTNQGSSTASDGVVRRRSKTSGTIQTIATGQAHPDRIAVSGDQVFWLNLGQDMGGATGWVNGAVMRASKLGGSLKSLSPATWPTDLAVDDEHVYFTEYSAGTIRRVGKSGITSAVTLVSTNEPGSPTAIAVDDTHVYWTLGCGVAADGVRRLSKDAAAASNCVSGPESLAEVHDSLFIAETGTWIYYGMHVHEGGEASPLVTGQVRRVWRNGGPYEVIVTGRGQIGRVAADSRGVVFSEMDADGPGIWAQHNDETLPRLLARSEAKDLAVDSGTVYWLDAAGVRKVDRAGGAAVLLASAQGVPQRLEVTPSYVFWTEDIAGEAVVRRVAKGGGTVQRSFATPGMAGDLITDVSNIYVAVHGTTGSAIHAVPRSGGGTPQVLATGSFWPRSLFEEEDMLVFTSESGSQVDLYRLSKTGILTRLANVDGVPADVAGDTHCVAWAAMDSAGHGSLWKMSRYSVGLLQAGEEAVFEAQLVPVNATEQGILPVSGTARFTIQGGQLTVNVDAVNMATGVTHPQHLHRRNACPTMADDANGDGYVDVVEALGTAGGVIVPLDPDLPYVAEQINFPAPDSNGTMAFAASASIVDLETAINKDLALETRSVMLHGVRPEFVFPATVQGIDGVPPHRNIPLACGVLVRVAP